MAVILIAGIIPDLPPLLLHDVHIIINPSKLWATINQLSPSVIIIDENMKPHNGRKLCRDIKQNKTTQHIAVILLMERSEFVSHADAVIQRPFDDTLFHSAVQKVLDL